MLIRHLIYGTNIKFISTKFSYHDHDRKKSVQRIFLIILSKYEQLKILQFFFWLPVCIYPSISTRFYFFNRNDTENDNTTRYHFRLNVNFNLVLNLKRPQVVCLTSWNYNLHLVSNDFRSVLSVYTKAKLIFYQTILTINVVNFEDIRHQLGLIDRPFISTGFSRMKNCIHICIPMVRRNFLRNSILKLKKKKWSAGSCKLETVPVELFLALTWKNTHRFEFFLDQWIKRLGTWTFEVCFFVENILNQTTS